jgi:hypothetical protein
MKASQLREEIFERIRERKITPDQGEAEAKRLGLEPLNPHPDLNLYNPLALVHWTFAMSIAWIAWGDPGKVREYWDDYRRHLSVWRILKTPQAEPDGSTKELETVHLISNDQPFGTYAILCLDALISERNPNIPVVDAKQKLWDALQKGELIADGIDAARGQRVKIPEHELQDLEISSHSNGEDGLRRKEIFRGPLEDMYQKPSLRREDVVALWPSKGIDVGHVGLPSKRGNKDQEQDEPVAPKAKLPPSSEKIRRAVEAEKKAIGSAMPHLRVGERNKRLADRMKAIGYAESEIPSPRTFYAYFKGPGKSGKSAKGG